MGILSPSKIFTMYGDKIIFKVFIMSPTKNHVNRDLVPIRNICYAWGQDNFQSLYLVPIQKICQWGSYPHQKFLLSIGTRWFSKSLSCPQTKIMSLGILSPSEIFAKHGDKIIFKIFYLSPSKMSMGILSPLEIFTKYGDKIIFKGSILSQFKKYVNGDLVPIRNIY